MATAAEEALARLWIQYRPETSTSPRTGFVGGVELASVEAAMVWAERAAIIEFEGQIARPEAEKQASSDLARTPSKAETEQLETMLRFPLSQREPS